MHAIKKSLKILSASSTENLNEFDEFIVSSSSRVVLFIEKEFYIHLEV
jgi:hypothetical protein